MKNEFPILNYPGSKRNLLEFIDKYTTSHIPDNKVFFDIFAGSGAVSYFYKDQVTVFANDSEKYSTVILNALLKFKPIKEINELIEFIKVNYNRNRNFLIETFQKWVVDEKNAINNLNADELIDIYFAFPNIWKEDLYINRKKVTIGDLKYLPYFILFTTYYSGSYFGIYQSIEIDSIRYAIEKIDTDIYTKYMLFSSLFYALKESTFSKDGHMAQPLDLSKNKKRLLDKRSVSILDKFISKVEDFYSLNFITSNRNHKVFNYKFEQLLENQHIFDDVGFIYADPPYTDMQYSRYFHLLNTLIEYDYPKMSLYRGKLSKGLYVENRYQSPLSQKSKALNYHKMLFDFCKSRKIGLSFSFAYPKDPNNQPTDRYVLNIFDLIQYGKDIFGENFRYFTQDYEHSNNRNSNSKKVLEYLLVYVP